MGFFLMHLYCFFLVHLNLLLIYRFCFTTFRVLNIDFFLLPMSQPASHLFSFFCIGNGILIWRNCQTLKWGKCVLMMQFPRSTRRRLPLQWTGIWGSYSWRRNQVTPMRKWLPWPSCPLLELKMGNLRTSSYIWIYYVKELSRYKNLLVSSSYKMRISFAA